MEIFIIISLFSPQPHNRNSMILLVVVRLGVRASVGFREQSDSGEA